MKAKRPQLSLVEMRALGEARVWRDARPPTAIAMSQHAASGAIGEFMVPGRQRPAPLQCAKRSCDGPKSAGGPSTPPILFCAGVTPHFDI